MVVSRDHPTNSGLTGKVKLIKVNLGMIYENEYAANNPDPWILAFNPSSNWSAFACPLYRNKRLKLATACSSDDSGVVYSQLESPCRQRTCEHSWKTQNDVKTQRLLELV